MGVIYTHSNIPAGMQGGWHVKGIEMMFLTCPGHLVYPANVSDCCWKDGMFLGIIFYFSGEPHHLPPGRICSKGHCYIILLEE